MSNQEIKINPEFEELIPKLLPDEFNQLRESILKEGCRDYLVLWEGFLIDGHNRLKICSENNIEFKTINKEFSDINQVKLWMISNQFARRNLNDYQKIVLSQKKKEILLQQGREKKIEAGRLFGEGHKKQEDLSIIDKSSISHNTQKEIAKDLNWSTGKVAQAEIVLKKAPPELKEKLEKSEVSINEAYKEIKAVEKKEKRRDEIEKQIEDIKEGKLPELQGKFEVISIDPPWPYGRKYDPFGSRISNPYPEISIEDIKRIELPYSDNCILFLWTTHKFLPKAFEIMEFWGFDYKATLVWDKDKMGMGDWFRMQCEFCLMGIKGSPYWQNTTERDILRDSRREHSRKPDSFFEMVNKICIGRRLEYFSREERPGWTVFGNDIKKF